MAKIKKTTQNGGEDMDQLELTDWLLGKMGKVLTASY